MKKKHKTFWWEHIKETKLEREIRLFIKSARIWWWSTPKDKSDRIMRFLTKFMFLLLGVVALSKLV